ncbi:DUF1015 family protein [Nocardioides currus]|uniref:DUF1015 domain-containing protein n=1 Tax=Nocardioides currus TaxID=2133958 RepID=A0A2R7YS36_9ACTN|nr:DUF1015 family protein [Nocardioides currus]PUA79218.1 hypothetical protein C7S10_19475 [Nocardioides currus]
MDFAAVITPPYVAKPLRLEPFRAMLLAPNRVGDPASARAFARPYRAVANRLLEWEADGRVTRSELPGLFLHEYTAGGLTIRGLVGALAMDRRADGLADRAIWPHEGIHPTQVDELATRMFEMGMNPAPILLVHEGPEDVRALLTEVATRPPHGEYLDRNEQKQRIWAITDPRQIDAINGSLAGGAALIADGHHRYAAYLQLQEAHPGTAWDRGLAMLVDQTDTPLFLGAIHRTINGVSLDQVCAAAVLAGGAVHPGDRDTALAELAPNTVVVTDSHAWAVLTPPHGSGLELVEWLQSGLIPVLEQQPTSVAFHHSAEDALGRATARTVAALLPAPDFAAVRDLVNRGGLLPEKATSFQPKPSLGVIMRSLRDEPSTPT